MASTAILNPAGARKPFYKAIPIALAVLLSGVLLYWSLRGIDWRQVVQSISGARLDLLGLACATASGSLFLRALRWRILLRAEGDIGVSAAFWATSAGYFGNNFLPARAGELVRTLFITTRSGLSNAYVLTTAASERMTDALALVAISAAVLLAMPVQPGWLAAAAKPFAALGLCGILGIALLPRLERCGTRILQRAPAPDAIRTALCRILDQVVRAVRAFHNWRRTAGFVALTMLIWCTDAAMTLTVAKALSVPITWPVAFLLLTGLGLGSALPSTPGYVGIYQFVAVSVLTPFGISRTSAIAYILVAQALSYVIYGFWGGIGLWNYRRRGAV